MDVGAEECIQVLIARDLEAGDTDIELLPKRLEDPSSQSISSVGRLHVGVDDQNSLLLRQRHHLCRFSLPWMLRVGHCLLGGEALVVRSSTSYVQRSDRLVSGAPTARESSLRSSPRCTTGKRKGAQTS